MNLSLLSRFKHGIASALLLCVLGHSAQAIEVAGVKFEDTEQVASKELKLNGAGVRGKLAGLVKVYVAGLYLTEKKSSPADILALSGPKRMKLIMMRELSADTFGEAFMAGLNDNSDKAEKSKIINQTMAFGEMFASMPILKKGDVLYLDWIPGTGTVSSLNGKAMGTVPDVAFFNAVLKIWIGDKPVDSGLKPALLGGKS